MRTNRTLAKRGDIVLSGLDQQAAAGIDVEAILKAKAMLEANDDWQREIDLVTDDMIAFGSGVASVAEDGIKHIPTANWRAAKRMARRKRK